MKRNFGEVVVLAVGVVCDVRVPHALEGEGRPAAGPRHPVEATLKQNQPFVSLSTCTTSGTTLLRLLTIACANTQIPILRS